MDQCMMVMVSTAILVLVIIAIVTFWVEGSGCFRLWAKGPLHCITNLEYAQGDGYIRTHEVRVNGHYGAMGNCHTAARSNRVNSTSSDFLYRI